MITHAAVYAIRRKATKCVEQADNKAEAVSWMFWLLFMEHVPTANTNSVESLCKIGYEAQFCEKGGFVVVTTTTGRDFTEVEVGEPDEIDLVVR